MLVKKSSSQPSSPAATESSQTSPSQFPFTFPSQPVRVPSSPCFTTEVILHPNSEFIDQLTIDGKIFNSPNVSYAEFYPITLRNLLSTQVQSESFLSGPMKHTLSGHGKTFGEGKKGKSKSQFSISTSQIQTAAKSVINHPNLVVRCGQADFFLIGNFSRPIGNDHSMSGVELRCWSLCVVVRNSQVVSIIPLTCQHKYPNPIRS